MTAAGDKKYRVYVFILFAVFLALSATQLRNDFTNPDGIGYYAHLRSAALDRDMFFLNEFERLKLSPYFFDPSPTGYIQNQWPVGSALLWAPFFAAAQALEAVARAPRDGYSPFDALAVAFGTAFYGFLALLLCMSALRRLRYPPWICFAAVALLWFGTPFLYYQFYEAAMAHVCSAFAASLFVYLWIRGRENRSCEGWALLGFAAGLAALTRTELAILAVIPAADALFNSEAGPPGKRALCLATYGFSAFIMFIPQLIVWRVLNGGFLASYQGTANFIWSNPHPVETLFSDYHGLFAWSPGALLAAFGWAVRARRDERGANSIVFAFAAFVYAVSCLIWWWGSGAFGARFFVGLFPLFAIGLAAFLSAWKRPALPVAIAAACSLWTVLLMLQALTGKIWLVRFYTFKQLAANSLAIIASPAAAIKILVTPKFIGLPAAPAIAGVAAAAILLFIATRRFRPKISQRVLIVLIVAGLSGVVAFQIYCARNSGSARKAGAAGVERAALYPLDELYETFPLQYADYYVRKGRPRAALSELKKLEKEVPSNPAVYVAEAGVLLSIGKREAARAKIGRASQFRIRHPMTLETLEKLAAEMNK